MLEPNKAKKFEINVKHGHTKIKGSTNKPMSKLKAKEKEKSSLKKN